MIKYNGITATAKDTMTIDNTNPDSAKQRLGEILISRNIISQEQLEMALTAQQQDKDYLGEILIKLGYVDQRDIVVALVVQRNIPYIAINKYNIDKSILDLIPKNVAQKYKVIALDKVGNVLSVVMVDPLDDEVKSELKELTKLNIAPFIATREEIEKAIEKWMGKGTSDANV